MPLPETQLTGEVEGVSAGCVEEFGGGEWHLRGMEDAAAESQEWDEQNELKWVDEVVAYLRSGDVEAEDGGHRETEDGGAAEDGVDTDEEADADAPG